MCQVNSHYHPSRLTDIQAGPNATPTTEGVQISVSGKKFIVTHSIVTACRVKYPDKVRYDLQSESPFATVSGSSFERGASTFLMR